MDYWRIVHILALMWFAGGLGATLPYIYRAYRSKDLRFQMFALSEAANNETRVLLPGMAASGITGAFWGLAEDYNFFTTGWLATLTLVYILTLFVFLPLMGFGLRRARLYSLLAAKKGEFTDELRDVLSDNVPIVFGTLILLMVPVMAWLPIFKPF
jgi:hypothetical protein